MGWWLAIALAVAAVVVFLVRSPVFRAYRRRKKAIGSEGSGTGSGARTTGCRELARQVIASGQ